MLVRRLGAITVMALLGCGGADATDRCAGLTIAQCAAPDAGAPNGGTPVGSSLIVDTEWLQARFGDSDVQAIDTRASGYDASRLPGAIQVRPGDLSATVDGVPSQVAPPLQAEPALRAAGLRSESIAVVYGGASDAEYDAARVAWALRYYGHDDVRYLDGGYDAWVSADGAVDTDPPTTEPSAYAIVEVDESLRVTGSWVLSQLGTPPYDMPAIQLVDARSESEYGNGRIPTARSVNWTRNLEGGVLRSESELETLYEGLDLTKTTVTYCVSGRRGSFAWLTLTALGYDDVRLYDGSWNEWGNGSFPVEQ